MENVDRPYILEEANYKSVINTQYKLAVLPWGATEAHNYHLPYATDNYQVEHVARKAAQSAFDRGVPVLTLPCVPFGINTGQLDIDFCLNVLPSTQMAVLKDLVDVLVRQKIEKLILLNGHGGNHFKNMIREMSFHFPQIFICAINWFEVVDWNQYFTEPGDHAGEMETSAMMHIRPDLVRPLSEAGDGAAKKINLSGFREGWATTQRPWSQVTRDTGVGNPAEATAEKGKKYMDDCSEKLADFYLELANTPNDELYT